MNKKVTVVTVCFCAKQDLKKTLDSVLAQTYEDMEYIVVDGDSKDGTKDLLKRYEKLFAKQGKAFRYVSERDNGTYDAMNKGCMMAKGEWINYMNAGDSFFSEDTLSSFFSHRIDDDAEVIYGNTLQEYDFGSGIATPKDFGNEVMPFCHQSCFVRRATMQQLRFDTKYRIVADHDLFYRIHSGGGKYQYINETVACYNGQYGLSATHPLTLHLELLHIYHVNEKRYYPLSVLWCYLRYGWVQPFKDHMPRWMTDAWMKHKRKYIKD